MAEPHFSEMTALRDAHRGLSQQMVWWGRDVRHPGGNLLSAHGMRRSPSPGLPGTSCYGVDWEGGWIELHGAVASWVGPDSEIGCVFCRDSARLGLWCGREAPVPGRDAGSPGNARDRWSAAQPLLRWVLRYETWVHVTCGPQWRQACRATIRRLPQGKPWLPPAAARHWWELATQSLPPRAKTLLASGSRCH